MSFGSILSQSLRFDLQKDGPADLSRTLGELGACKGAVDLILGLTSLDIGSRISIKDALSHSWITNRYHFQYQLDMEILGVGSVGYIGKRWTEVPETNYGHFKEVSFLKAEESEHVMVVKRVNHEVQRSRQLAYDCEVEMLSILSKVGR